MRDDEEDKGEDEDDHSKKRMNSGPEASQRRLACPFFKRNPPRYSEERSCVGPGWLTVHRLK